MLVTASRRTWFVQTMRDLFSSLFVASASVWSRLFLV